MVGTEGARDPATRRSVGISCAWLGSLVRVASVFLLSLVLGCTAPQGPGRAGPPVREGVSGHELVYQFPTGRTYRAAYTAESVSFALLVPRLDDPPSATMPYVSKRIREGVYLIVWDSEAFHTTFVIDLERRELHASARRGGSDRFIGTAKILSVRPIDSVD